MSKAEVEPMYYELVMPGAKPRYDPMLKLLYALGVKLSASPVDS
jgi:DNA-binding phage protein